MKNINKKEIVIRELNKELKYYKANKRKFNIDKYNLTYMRLLIEHLKTYDENDSLFENLAKEQNLLLNLATDIADLDIIDKAIFDEIFGHYFKDGQVEISFVCDEDDLTVEDDEGFIYDNEDC